MSLRRNISVSVLDVCVFKNSQYYRQDQQWYDGCNAVCRCENAATGYYRCQERCVICCQRYPVMLALVMNQCMLTISLPINLFEN